MEHRPLILDWLELLQFDVKIEDHVPAAIQTNHLHS